MQAADPLAMISPRNRAEVKMSKKLSIDDFLFDCIYLLGMIDSIALSLSDFGALPHMDIVRMGIRLSVLTIILVKLVLDRE